MQLGKVIGTVTATIKVDDLDGVKLMVVEPVDHKRVATGKPIVAVDTVQAGVGDHIYWVSGREASMALSRSYVPVDAAIVGIVDEVDAL